MRIHDLDGKKICILGFGREGQAMLRALERYAPEATITIAAEKIDQLSTINYQLSTGPQYLNHLADFDVIIKSPGIPPKPEFEPIQNKITSSTQIFLDTVKDSGSTVIGITGSKGKSTTTTLIYEILKRKFENSNPKFEILLVGNIGIPAIDYLEHAKSNTIFVQEMSSYQLMDLTTSPQIAVVTSFFPEHLDYHGSLDAYKEAKKHVARFQTKHDTVFYNDCFPEAKEIAEESPGKKIPYSIKDAPVKLKDIKLRGEHNLINIAGAWKAAESLGADRETAVTVIKAFKGLPHRLESIGVHHGIEWIDDAISTTPESAIAALDALDDNVATIILGGQDRGYDFSKLAQRIARSLIKTVILFPGSGPRIREAIGNAHADVCFHEADSMERAVELARKHTMQGKICLLSTASPSYGMFKNFEEKGERFQACIRQKNS